MTFQEYYDYMGWTTDVEWALGLTEEELLALPDFPYHEAKNIRLAHHHLRPRTEEEKEVRRKAQEAWDKEHPHYNHYHIHHNSADWRAVSSTRPTARLLFL
jgi:hypothetical protein